MDFGIIRRHPFATAGIVFAGGIVFVLMHNAGGSGAGASGSSGGGVSAQAQAAAVQGQYATTLAQIAAGTQTRQAEIAGGVATQQSSDQLTGLLAAIQAEMSKDSLAAAVDNNQIAAQTHVADLSADVAKYQIGTQAGLAQAQLNVQAMAQSQAAALAASQQQEQAYAQNQNINLGYILQNKQLDILHSVTDNSAGQTNAVIQALLNKAA